MIRLFILSMMGRKYLGQQLVCCFQMLLRMLVSAKTRENEMIINTTTYQNVLLLPYKCRFMLIQMFST